MASAGPAGTHVNSPHAGPHRFVAARAPKAGAARFPRLERRRPGRVARGPLSRHAWDAVQFAEIDSEGYLDFQAIPADVTLVEGLTRQIDWPENVFFHAAIPGADRDVVLLLGIEPNLRWRTFAGLVVDLAKDLGVELVVTLGSLLADVPHTRPAPVTAAASDLALVEEMGLELSRYEGPTGIVGITLDGCRQVGIGSVSLWAAVPHYVSLAPSPRAARALCYRFGDVLGVSLRRHRAGAAADELRGPGHGCGVGRRRDAVVRRGARAARRSARSRRTIFRPAIRSPPS